MSCPEERVVAFLAGDLPEAEERGFDQHLLTCERCWQAVQADRASRAALEHLRVPAPSGLQDRVRLSVSLARPAVLRSLAPAGGLRSWRPATALAGACMALAAGALAWVETRPPADPPQVSAVAAMVTGGPAPAALAAGEHMMIAHQPLMVRAYEVEGKETLVATSPRPFPVPPSSHQLSSPTSRAWMATRGHLSMYGVNRPGGQSMFLVAAMPMADLPQVAAELHLI